MPPITDPNLLAQIQQQQQSAPRTLASPPPYYPGPSAAPVLPHGTRPATTDPFAAGRFGLSVNADKRAQAEFDEKYNIPKPPGDLSKTGDEYLESLKQAGNGNLVLQIQAMREGRMPYPAPAGAGARNPQNAILRAAALQAFPDLDATDVATRIQTRKEFLSNKTGTPGASLGSANTLLGHLNSMYNSATALHNTGIPLVNAPKNVYEKYVGGSGPIVRFGQDQQAVIEEMERLWRGTGGNVTEIENWKKNFSQNSSPEQFRASIGEAVNLIQSRLQTLADRYNNGMKQSVQGFELLRPDARQIFDRFAQFNTPGYTPPEEDKKLSTTEKAFKVPPGYQDEHAQFLSEHPPGTLTEDQYIKFRQEMDKKYDVQTQDYEKVGKDFVEPYNKSKSFDPQTPVPPTNRKLSDEGLFGTGFMSEKKRAEGAASREGVFVRNLTNAGTVGLVDLAAGQEGRDAAALADEAHSGAALGGELVGSVIGMGGLERGTAKLAAKLGVSPQMLEKALGGVSRAKLASDVGVNAAYGGARGYTGADEGQGGSGFIRGVAGGTLGALGGNLVTKGLTPVLSDATQAALERVKGVKLTTLQKLGLGHGEESLSGIPFAHGARQEAMRSMNVDNVDRVLANIGKKVPRTLFGKSVAEPGTSLNAYMNDQINQAYGKIRPKIFGATDAQFDNGIMALQAQANTPDKKAMFQEILDAVDKFKDPVTGLYNGDGYQAASMRLRSLVKDFSQQAESSGSIPARDMARMAEQARKQMQFQIQRTAPEVATELKGIERAYAHSMRIEDATNRALTASDTGVYSPGQLLTSIKKLDTSLNKGATARGKAFDQQYAEAAAKILGHGNVPKISPRETAIVGGALGGVTYASPHVAAFMAAVGTGLYGPGVKKVIQALASGKRPKTVDNEIARRAFEDFIRHSETGN